MSNSGFRRVLVAFDGSDNSFRACEAAAIIAKGYGSELILIQAIPPLSIYSAPMREMYYSTLEEGAVGPIKKAMSSLEDLGVKGKSEIIRARESIVGSITEYALDSKSDIIVAGTRGLGGFKRMLVGSVSDGLVTHSPCPVLVVRDEPLQKKVQLKRILAATDGSESASKAVRIAASLAKVLSGDLIILNVVHISPFVYSNVPGVPIDRIEEDARRDGERIVNEANLIASDEGVKAEVKVIQEMESPIKAIEGFSEENKIDLIVVGTRGLTGFKKLALGSVAHGIVHYVGCNVLVVR